MKSWYLNLIFFFLTINSIFCQSEVYVHWDKGGYSGDLIEFYSGNRFRLIHDESCYNYCTGAGFYKLSNDSIFLDFFQIISSESEIIKLENKGISKNISIQVLSLQDSTAINSATVFARETTRDLFDFKEKVDCNGTLKITVPTGLSIDYLRVYDDNFIDLEIYDLEQFDTDFLIKIYLSRDPLTDLKYIGPTDRREVAIKKGRRKIIYNGVTYKSSF